jgi:uncharacterized protein YegP (UPF0339 family)
MEASLLATVALNDWRTAEDRLSSAASEQFFTVEAIVAGKFEVYQDKAGKFRFRLKASNGQVVATGEAYETRAAAKKGCESVVKASTGAPVVEVEA